ncbi:hypothetical protein C8Q79DRAFT_1002186 [Trametes meyenii]|nr:hypothetical protein C8Q79DRAFT_1002186 [Trametes meyenii]
MMFSKTLIAAAALCLSVSLQVHAHATIAPALGIKGAPVRNDAQRPSKGKECGKIDIAKNFDSSQAIQAATNGSFAATITNFNGGVDGSRQVTALVDPTGTGKSFVSADVLKNGDKNPSSTGSQQLVVQLPSGTTCKGGASKDKCLVSFTTAGGFGNCVVVQQDTASPAANNAKSSAAGSSASANGATTATDVPKTVAGKAVGTSAAASVSVSAPSASASTTGTPQDQSQDLEAAREALRKEIEQLEKELSQHGPVKGRVRTLSALLRLTVD